MSKAVAAVKGFFKATWDAINGHKTWIGALILAEVVPIIKPEVVISFPFLADYLTVHSIPLVTIVSWIGNALTGAGLMHKFIKAGTAPKESPAV